ncbi:amidase [Polynucleobacter sp. AM-7D1]|uniref:amidase n=1 Tax=Polynucleobacter sp. AM-7D1 TaxID=2689102 RepID=UPI001BFE7791|nr:amidase [Polynucleobacter sp. AM-7D1]QWE29515.1 amidase [Polynucleobacter sp. AM-7D1]
MKPALGLIEACNLIASKQLSANDYLKECVARADELEPSINAFTARASLEKLIQEVHPGPLMGIPVVVKDLIDTKDLVTSYGSPIYKNHIPAEDAQIVAQVRKLGGVILGKTVTTEFAWRTPGKTSNPWNLAHTPGGSSSGSAAAVASGIAPLGLGSQTAGSIIRPATYCGVVGYKASFGTVPRLGVHPVSSSLDHVGFFTRSVADAAFAFNLLKNTSITEEDDLVIDEIVIKPICEILHQRTPHIAVLKTPFDDLLSDEQSAAMKAACISLEKSGATTEALELPAYYWEGIEALAVLMSCEAAVVHEQHLAQHPELISADIKELVQKGNAYSAPDYIKAKNLQQRLKKSIGEVFTLFDAILAPAATGEAPKGLEFTGNPIFCSLWSLIGTPAIAIPFTKSQNGLPLGVQLIGDVLDDQKLINIAAFAEDSFRR